jgi:hypothetical protein
MSHVTRHTSHVTCHSDVILDALAQRLRTVGLSNDPAVLADMSAKLQKHGTMNLDDLRGVHEEGMKVSVVTRHTSLLGISAASA